jgi:hypothetical protein
MEKKINNTLLFTAKDGMQMVFKVLFTFHSERFDKDYAVFYNEADENHLIAYSYDENKTFSFMYSIFSSYLCYGEYKLTSEGLTLNTSDGKFTYFFEAVDGGWRFVAGKSSVIPSYRYSGNSQVSECPVPDGAVFELITQPQ